MNSKNIKRIKGNCQYCLRTDELLYGVNLRHGGKFTNNIKFICENCLGYLTGVFRYDRSVSQKDL